MADSSQFHGIVLTCTRDGAIVEVLQDTLGIAATAAGRPFTDLVLAESLKNAQSFLDAVRADDTSYNWGVYVSHEGRRTFLHVTGYAINGHIVVIGAPSRVAVGQLYHRTLRVHHEQLNALKSELSALQNAQAEREQQYLSYVDKLNEQIGALQRSLSQKEAETPPAASGSAERERALEEQSTLMETLRQSEAALAAMFRSCPIPLAILSRESGSLVNMSDSFERLLGAGYDELAGKPLGDALTRASQDAAAQATAGLSPASPARELSIKFRRRDGELRDGMLSLRLLELPGARGEAGRPAPPAVLAAIEDITDQVRVNQSLNADLTAAREQNVALADELRQREFQFKNRLGSWTDPVNVSEVELRLYQQREQEMRLELESLRRAERELTQQVTTLHDRLASLGAQATRYRELLADQAPLLRDYADALETATAGLEGARAEQAAALAERRERERALARQISTLRAQVTELELRGERYKQMLAEQAPLLREHAALMEQLTERMHAAEASAALLGASRQEPKATPDAGAHAEVIASELTRHQSANRSLAEQLAYTQRQSDAERDTMAEQLRLMRERSALVEVELGRRQQRQQGLAAEIEALKTAEVTLRAQVAAMSEQLAGHAAQTDQQERAAQTLREQADEKSRAADEAAAQIAALRGELLLRDLEIGRLKTSEQSVAAQRGQLHNAMRALEVRLKRIRRGREPETELPAAQTVPPRPTTVPESLLSPTNPVPAERTADESAAPSAFPPPDTTGGSQDPRVRMLMQTVDALRLELGTMHQKEQALLRKIAELDRQVRLLEWQHAERPAVVRDTVSDDAVSDDRQPMPARMGDFVHLLLEMTEESNLAQALVAEFAAVMGAPGACLLVWDGDGSAATPRETHGLYEQEEALLPPNAERLSRTEPEMTVAHALEGLEGLYTTLSLPLAASGQAFGMLLLTFESSHQFGEQDVARAEFMAREFALALRMAWKRQQEQRTHSWIRSQAERQHQLALRLAGGDEQLYERLARDLKTGASQNLTILSVYLDDLASGLSPENAEIVRGRVRSFNALVEEIGRSVRDVLAELYPPLVEEEDLLAVARWFGARFAERTGVPTTVRCDTAAAPRFQPAVARTLFRILQDTLTNLEKPDPGYPVRITLSDLDDRARLSISGGEAMAAAGHWERFRLKERAEAIGGQLRFESGEGQVMRLIVEVAKR